MKVKREKTHKRFMSLYHNAFKFRTPYQLIVDGTFLHACRASSMQLLEGAQRTLVGDTKLMTTYCCYAELKKLGPDFRPTAAWAKKLQKVHKCNHSPAISAAECIKEVIGIKNENRFCVASNDKNLRIYLRTIPAVPLLYINKSVMILEPPSQSTLSSMQESEIHKTEPKSFEVSVRTSEADEITDTKKRKRRKEPNPLSVKKSKKNPLLSKKDNLVEDINKNKSNYQEGCNDLRKRKRKKRKSIRLVISD